MTSIRVVLGLVVVHDLELEQLDVKTSFLHGDLEEELYMKQLKGFEEKGKETLVCKLNNSLYGLKQAPRQWYPKFDSFMSEQNFSRCESDHCVYSKFFDNGKFVLLLLYVDDMLVAGSSMVFVNMLKQRLSKTFSMKDLGVAKQILGMKIIRDGKKKELILS
jgi:hypothetical protein